MCVSYPYYNPARDVPTLAGKVILVTGGTSGMGKEAATQLSRYGRPAQIWIAGRRADEGGRAIAHIRKWSGVPAARSVTSEPASPHGMEDMDANTSRRLRVSRNRPESEHGSSYNSSPGTPKSSTTNATPAISSSASSRSRGSSVSGGDDEAAAPAAAPTTQVRFLYMDLASLESVRDAAARFLASVDRLDILILGAGEVAVPSDTTAEGYERHMGVNHLGHALLLKLLMRLLVRTATCDAEGSDVRVVSISSMAHRFVTSKGIDFDALKPGLPSKEATPVRQSNLSCPSNLSAGRYSADPSSSSLPRSGADDDDDEEDDEEDGRSISSLILYGQSKLANILYARELAERCPLFTTVSLNPGIPKNDGPVNPRVRSGSPLMDRIRHLILPLFGLNMSEAVKNHLWAATAKEVKSGEYYEPVGVPSKGTAFAQDRVLAWKLWEWTQKELEGYTLPEKSTSL